MVKKERTYMVQASTVEWIDAKADEENVSKSEVVDRAVRYYATMLASDNGWNDDHWNDNVDDAFERNIR